jgi:hypothetical protein
MQAHLAVIPGKLYFARIPLQFLHDGSLSQALLRLLFGFQTDNFYLNRRSRSFFSYTQTPHEISLIIDEADVTLIPAHMITVETSCFTAVQISEGDLGFQSTGIVQRLSTPLAQANISVMYISTFLTDFIFIKTSELQEALECLRTHFTIVVDDQFEAAHLLSHQSLRPSPEIEHETGSMIAGYKPTPSHQHLLSLLPLKLCITLLEKQMVYRHIPSLIQLLLFPPSAPPSGRPTFISFTETEDEISLIHEDGFVENPDLIFVLQLCIIVLYYSFVFVR